MDKKECPACHRQVSHLDDQPPQSDSQAWRDLSQEHAPDCDWVRTHAPATQALTAAVAGDKADEPVDR